MAVQLTFELELRRTHYNNEKNTTIIIISVIKFKKNQPTELLADKNSKKMDNKNSKKTANKNSENKHNK